MKHAIKHLNRGTSAGPTDSPPELLYNLSVEYLEQIYLLCQKMWENETVPDENHLNDRTFLHKKRDTDKLSNYRTLATGMQYM